MSNERSKLMGKLGVMFTYAIAHMQTVGVSKGKQDEFKIAYQQIRLLIQHYSKLTIVKYADNEVGIESRQKPEIDEEIVMRYTVLFHDASPFLIPQLIRKLIKETQIIRDVRGGKK